MAIYKSGILGRPSGKMGKTVFYMLNGQSVARSIGKPGKISELQRANHQAMAVTMRYLKHMVEFVNHGFGAQAIGTTKNPFNLATSYNKKHALKGQYPDLSVDYSKVLLSQGVISPPAATTFVKSGTGIEVSWDAYTDMNSCKKDDMVMIMLFHTGEKGTGVTRGLYAAQRREGKCFIQPGSASMDQPMEGYMFFKSNDGKRVSDSVYLGNLNGVAPTLAEKEEKEAYEKVKERFVIVEVQYNKYLNETDSINLNRKKYYSMNKEYEVLKKQLAEMEDRLGYTRSDE